MTPALGALIRPRTPAEDKYHRASLGPPPGQADLSKPVSLVTEKGDPRPPVFDQGGEGSCGSCTAAKSVEAAHNYVRLSNGNSADAQAINPGPIYARARQQEGWFPQDSGTYLADNFDAIRTGVYLLSDEAYVADPAKDYAEAKLHEELDYELSHQPFYPGDGQTLEHIWLALAAGLPVAQGCYWLNEWFAPKGGKLPAGITSGSTAGHFTWIWSYRPEGGGFLLCRNSWGKYWSADAAQFGFDMRPGDFAVPVEYYTRSNSPFWEFRAISPEAVQVEPPDPPPDPKAVPSVFRVKAKPATAKYVVIGDRFDPAARVTVDGSEVATTFQDENRLLIRLTAPLPLGSHWLSVVNPGPGANSVPFNWTV